jgi:hypothetical protein
MTLLLGAAMQSPVTSVRSESLPRREGTPAMMNFPANNFSVYCEVADQQRRELLAEAERDRLVRQATVDAMHPARSTSGDARLHLLARIRLALRRPAAAPAGTRPA